MGLKGTAEDRPIQQIEDGASRDGMAMKIKVEVKGFPIVSDVIGKKTFEVDIEGPTVRDVIENLIRIYGRKVKEAFYDEGGRFDPIIQVCLNGKTFLSPEELEKPILQDGDTLAFLLLLAGG